MLINGPALRAIRERKGLTQVQLADLAGVGRTIVTNLENGRRNTLPPNAKAIADALGVAIDDFAVFDTPEPAA